ncbi:MAG TPA: OmpH family outer membrane protein [Stellaceae bacterium]|jgi:Skp family chaperone for outer membrane proteins|nr:OmpH family outer membrane protein [Stellaceae bacterium]
MISLGFSRGSIIALAALLVSGTAFAQSKAPAAPAASAAPAPAAAPAAAPAMPAPVPMVVDSDLILQRSKAAQDVERQLSQAQQAYEKQLSARDAQLHQIQQDLVKQQAKLSPEAFEKKRRDFEQSVATFQNEVQTKRQALDQAYNNAIQKVRQALFEVVAEIAKERHANLVMVKSLLILYLPAYDATDEALQMLDKKLTTVKVVIPAKPTAPAPTAAK